MKKFEGWMLRRNSDGTLYVRVDQIIFTTGEAQALAEALKRVASGQNQNMYSNVDQMFGDLDDQPVA